MSNLPPSLPTPSSLILILNTVSVQCQSDSEMRSLVKDFWEKKEATLESMTLIDDLNLIKADTDEVLDFLPDYSNKRVLELASGVGRFTGILARKAAHVTAVDYMQSFTDQNKKNNPGLDNVTFLCEDVSKIEFPPASFDLVFSGWLFTSLTDEDMEENFIRTLRWLAPGGHLFFRENCEKPEFECPGFYRTPLQYVASLQSARLQVPPLNTSGSNEAHFANIKVKSSLSYIKAQANPFECYFKAEKKQNPRPDTCQQFHLDHRYSDHGIAKLEWICGSSWSLPGEEFIVKKYYPRLGVSADNLVLNLSCGTGGSSFFMADFNDVKVHGVDHSPNAIVRAIFSQGKSYDKIKGKIQFEANDVMEMKLLDNCYDGVFSYGFLQTLTTTNNLFSKLYHSVTPGGRLLMVEYCRGTVVPPTNRNQSGWAKMTLEEYKRALKDAGWKGVKAEDVSNDLLETLRQSLDKFIAERENFVSKFSQQEFSHLFEWITNKVTELESQEITLGVFIAHK